MILVTVPGKQRSGCCRGEPFSASKATNFHVVVFMGPYILSVIRENINYSYSTYLQGFIS